MRFKGVTLDLGGTEYVMPPLSLGAIEQYEEELKTFTGATDIKSLKMVTKLAHSALKRNYPEMTLEEVSELVDFGNFLDVMDAIFGGSGLVKSKMTESMKDQTSSGTTSSAISHGQQDGHSPQSEMNLT